MNGFSKDHNTNKNTTSLLEEGNTSKLIKEQSYLYNERDIYKDFVKFLPSFTIKDLLYSRKYYIYYLTEEFPYMVGKNRKYNSFKSFLSKYNRNNINFKKSAIRTLNINIANSFNIISDIGLITEQIITTFKSTLSFNITNEYLDGALYYLQKSIVIHFLNHRFKNNFEYFNIIFNIIKILNIRLKLEYNGDVSFSYMVDIDEKTNEVEDIYMVCYLDETINAPLFVSNEENILNNDECLKRNLYNIDIGYIDNNFKLYT